MKKKRMSFRQIAKECDVSPATVSRIANGIGSFSQETVNAVKALLESEGYLFEEKEAQREKDQFIAVFVSDLSNEVFCNIATYISDYFRSSNITVSIFISRNTINDDINKVIANGAKGVFIIGNYYSRFSLESPVPVITIHSFASCTYKGISFSIGADEYVGGQLAAREFIKSGCTHPLILNNRRMDETNPRLLGFIDEFEKTGVPKSAISIFSGESSKTAFNSANDVVNYLIAKGEKYDCIYGCSDWRAYGAIVALKNNGLKVPEDVKVIGYDGSRLASYCDLPFTTIHQNPQEIAIEAFKMMNTLLAGNVPESNNIIVPVYIQKGLTA